MAKPLRSKLGKRLRELRLEKGWSQEQLADKASLHRTYIGTVERGEQNISIENVEKLAKALKLPTEELFKGL